MRVRKGETVKKKKIFTTSFLPSLLYFSLYLFPLNPHFLPQDILPFLLPLSKDEGSDVIGLNFRWIPLKLQLMLVVLYEISSVNVQKIAKIWFVLQT